MRLVLRKGCILLNFCLVTGLLSIPFNELSNVIRSETGQKDLEGDLGKMKKVVEDLKIELRLKDKEIVEKQFEIDTISLASLELNQDAKAICQNLRTKCSEIEILKAQLEQERENGMCPHFFESCFAE